jgi:hypothetical protein
VDVRGECCQNIFQSGVHVIIISAFGVKEKKADDETILDQVLKKISRRKSYFRWEEEDKLPNYRCSKCKKYRHSKQ